MNCKPGDLAILVKAGVERDEPYLGQIFTCLRIHTEASARVGMPVWTVTELDGFGVKDRSLRPIRDPGEDATDETLQWLPVPVKEAA
jgi:hypothetical protein